jgi:hypothetical protein
MAKRQDIERHRTPPRGVQAADQDPDGVAVGRHGGDVVLGSARLRPDQMRKVDGWQTLTTKLIDRPIDLAA